jgi:hypothetical protein
MDSEAQPSFIPGLELSRRFYAEVVEPILAARFPDLDYAAALIGPGSEVLGFDTPVSTDHHWGPRVMLFLPEQDSELAEAITETLSRELPPTFLGYSTNFGPPDEIGVRLLQPIKNRPVAHRVETWTVLSFFTYYLGWNTRGAPSITEWLAFPSHRLRAATSGAVFHESTGELTAARDALSWYPDDLWRYLLAAGWNRIAEEEAFMARCGDVGDELGSTLVAARLVRDITQLCFLMERSYAPYSKWLGTAFSRLRLGRAVEPHLTAAIRGATWRLRQDALIAAYRIVAEAHDALGLTDPLDAEARPFHTRPYLVIDAERFASALIDSIANEGVRALPRFLGSLNQLIDGTDKLESAELRSELMLLYR